jgi:hypothetical protein
MKCKCGNNINVVIAAKVKCEGCIVLPSMTTIATVKCEKCGESFQIPISSNFSVIKD